MPTGWVKLTSMHDREFYVQIAKIRTVADHEDDLGCVLVFDGGDYFRVKETMSQVMAAIEQSVWRPIRKSAIPATAVPF